METFTLSPKEVHPPGLLKVLCSGLVTNAQVAAALRITVRQVRRLKRRFEAGGPSALVHGNRGRPSPRRLPAAVRDAVGQLMTTVYVGFNDTHLTEKLREHHALGISRETVRRWREQLGQPPKRARRAPRAAEAQQPAKTTRIGLLDYAVFWEPLRQGLRALGYVEGQNITFEYRPTEGRRERLPDLAA